MISRNLIEHTAGRAIFGADANCYAEARPEYPTRVYDVLRTACGAGPSTNAFEIGPGTGQATERLLDLGWTVTAIEPDSRLSDVLSARCKPKAPGRLAIHTIPFEEADLPETTFDLGIAATSFHWLEQESALAKVRRLLKPNGRWAMWWTVFGDPANEDEFQRRTQFLFANLERSPSHGHEHKVPFALDVEKRSEQLRDAGFVSITHEVIRWTTRLTKKQTLALTATFSPVARLQQPEKDQFMERLGNIVDIDFGGTVSRNFVTAIYIAARPAQES